MRSRRGGIVLWMFFIVALTIFVSGSIAVYTIFMKPENKSSVPNFRERTIVDAVAEAEKLGLVVQIENAASTLPEGRVLAQSPAAGAALRKGQVVMLQVSRGGELHAVPDVKGQTLTQAQAVIKEQGFQLGDVVRIRESNIQAGTVIAQSPAAPANVASGRKIDLLVQDGSNQDGTITIPDVNRMTESEARNVLEAAGVKVQAVDRVYSPLLPEGLAIETRPAAGNPLRSGQGVTLKLATQRRPAGYMDSDSNNPNVRRVTAQQAQTQPASSQTPQQAQTRPATQTPAPAQTPAPQTSQPAPSSAPAAPRTQPASGATKTARIRYQVPPLARPMNLRIELTDPSGRRDILNRQVRSNEGINLQANYSNECVVSIYLGGEFVWQERYR